MEEIKPFIDVKNIPLDEPSSSMSLGDEDELQGEIRIGTAIKRLIVLDENNILLSEDKFYNSADYIQIWFNPNNSRWGKKNSIPIQLIMKW